LKLPDLETVRQLISLVEQNELEELSVTTGEQSLTLRREIEPPPAAAPEARAIPPTEAAPPTATAPPPESQKNLVHVSSPIVGVFYRAPDPDSEPYVKEGALVDETTVVGLVEAMKVFNEIVAGVHGRVVAIPAQNEQLVSRGETLVLIDPAA